ncbi:recombinase family protein [Flavobacterium sp. CHNK8]|uniref:recombinase family protein n=1 Tax=Flavobacterium sp. CHNK8 TaxID=2871165 RepID=UPI001C8E9870|nr:recombinase family protein [Flavobacterium sp. CHNK8]QZK90680.1 recombinase family protein [Flavobacterium sp. CHNK8]
MDKVAIYARVSTVDGKQEFERQVNDLTRIIKNSGYTDEQIEIFTEKISGYKKVEDRPELTRMLNICETTPQHFKAIYITEVSRLGRNPRTTRDSIERLCDLGVQLHISNPPLSTLTTEGTRNNIVHMMLGIAIEFADIEAKTTKTRMASGKLTRAMKGKTTNNNQPYGYTSNKDGYIIIDEDEKIIIEQIFESYQSGIGTRVIANTLNEMKVPTKLAKTKPNQLLNFNKSIPSIAGNDIKWTDVVIRQILINTIYKGEKKYLNEIINVEPIISVEVFNECNELLKSKKTRNILTKYEYLLKDVIRCGCCGRVYMGRYIVKGDAVYRCTSSLKTRCANRSINISLIESVIYSLILNSDALLKTLDNPNDMLNQIKKELKQQEQLLKNEEKELTAKEKQLENLLTTMTLSANPNFSLYTKMESGILTQINLLKDKIGLLKKDIFSKVITIQNFNIEATSRDMIVKAQHNRKELKSIFKQFVHSIIINDMGNGYVLANLTIKINGVVYTNQRLKLFIYADGVRKYGGRNEKLYKYLSVLHLINEATYKNSILTTDIQDIKEEFERLDEQTKDTTGLLPPLKFNQISKENRLYINEFDL